VAFVYCLAPPEGEMELAQAELRSLAGCQASGRLADHSVACDVSRAAYVAWCGEVVGEGRDLEELCEALRAREVPSDGFRIDVRATGGGVGEDSMQITRRLADALPGRPDLTHPRVRFLALCQVGSFRLVRLLSQSRRGHVLQAKRPRHLSHALPARQARMLVNLVAAPGDALVDPCCGVGTCLLEALEMGVRAVGFDLSHHAVTAARENLAHFGYTAPVRRRDARLLEGHWDAAVVDFPYGHTCHHAEGLYEEILGNLAARATRIGVVAGRPVEEVLAAVGLIVVNRAQARKNQLVRYYYATTGTV
jgi:tRNA (guanine10-N2)-dimethyltransferase